MPFAGGDASDEDLLLVAADKMKLPEKPVTGKEIEAIIRMPKPSVSDNAGIQALLEEREEGW